MTQSESNSSLNSLVEAHDVTALEEAISRDPNLTCFSFDNLVGVMPKCMREFLRNNKSAVERACEKGYLDIVTIFLQHGCSPNLPTSHGRLIHTVLVFLKSRRDLVDNREGLHLISLMISKDCDVNVKDFEHRSPLMIAAELASAPIMEIILQNSLDWQLYPEDGFTPLHMACMRGDIHCVRLLTSRMTRESLKTCDKKHNTPLMYSVMMIHKNFDLHMEGGEEKEKQIWEMQHRHMAVIESLLHAGVTHTHQDELEDRGTYHIRSVPTKPSMTLIRMVNYFEFISNVALWHGIPLVFLENEWELVDQERLTCIEGVMDIQEDDQEIDIKEKKKKAFSPYSCLLRLLIFSGLDFFKIETFEDAVKEHYSIRGFLIEVKYFLEHTRHKHTGPVKSLLSLCRSRIRLEAGKNEKLHKLQYLPLPWKLICYVMFIDF